MTVWRAQAAAGEMLPTPRRLVTSAPHPTARLRCADTFTCVPGNATGPTPPAKPCPRATQSNDEPVDPDTGVPGAEKGAAGVGAAGIMRGVWATTVDDLHSPTYRNYSMFHTNTTMSAAPEWDTVCMAGGQRRLVCHGGLEP